MNVYTFSDLNYSDYVRIDCNISKHLCTFLNDSQADISVIKLSSIQVDIPFDNSIIIKIKGITDNIIESLGTISIDFFFDDVLVSHTFHVVPDEFNIPSDGIIGKDFNRRFNCVIDYGDMTFTIRAPEHNIHLKIYSEPKDNYSALAARCETFRIFHIENFSGPCLIPGQEIDSGVIIPNTIAHEEKVVIRVLNSNTDIKLINNKISGIPLNEFNIYTFDKNSISEKERQQKLNQFFAKTPQHARDQLTDLCMKYTDIFALAEDRMTTNNFYTQKLRLKNDDPVYVRNYRLPKTQKDEIDKQVKKLLDNDLIEPSTSSYNSPLILVPKKSQNGEKKWRMCVDYRMLNKNLIADKFPLPRIDEILDNLGRAKYFSILDLFSGFWQIPIEQGISREITSFSTDKGAYQWKVLPFGINVAPNSFSRMMALAFSGLPPENAFIYMDDLIVIGTSIKNHLENLENVFKICRKYNLKLNPEKCEFFRPEVTFLGHSCTENGIRPDSKKLEAIDKYPKPDSKEACKRFIAFANYYRRFIRNFADIVRPMNKLTRKKANFVWSIDCELAFNQIREILKSKQVLAYPDFNKEFIVTVDASTFACGAVLSQMHGDQDRPIAYISKTFKKGEMNKPIIEKELLAIHFAITTFRPYLYGTHFTVMSDHRPLVYLYGLKDPSSKLTRIRLELEEYNFEVIHIKGKDNVVADALSRISFEELKEKSAEANIFVTTRSMTKKMNASENTPDNIPEVPCTKPKIYEQLDRAIDKKIPRIRSYVDDKQNLIVSARANHKCLLELEFETVGKVFSYENILSALETEATKLKIKTIQWPMNDIIMQNVNMNDFKKAGEKYLKLLQIVIIPAAEVINDEDKKKEIMTHFHNDPIFGGHMGKKKMYAKIRSKFYWKNMSTEIAKFIQSCEICHLTKPKSKIKAPMVITPTPQSIFDTVIIDTIGPLPMSENGNLYAVTMICDFSKYLVSVAIPNKEAKTVAKAIFENFILIYGIMKEIRTDCGTEYKNQIVSELCKLLKIEHSFSLPYRHESVGSIERNHRFYNQYIRAYIEDMIQWEEFLKYFTFCYNISPHSSFNNRFTPYQLVFNKNHNVKEDLVGKVDPLYNFENYVLEAKYRLQIAHKEAQKLLIKSKEKNKLFYDKEINNPMLKVGDTVYAESLPYNKHKNVNQGPFIITQIDEPNVVVKDKNNKNKTFHKNQIRL